MQLIEELEDKYNQYTGKNFSFLSDRGYFKNRNFIFDAFV